ncbi:MAG: hypothetical protein NC417_13180 [Candidatus Gastranaerophilales bacterium]|nr:hypothetical protein [Candidatus Gastranaerophilales bacterium]
MRFLTSFYRRGEDRGSSLTLQQVVRVRGKLPLVLACVCGEEGPTEKRGDGAAFCVNLTDWFHESALVSCGGRKEPDLSLMMEEVSRMAKGCFSAAGIFCLGNQFFLFYRGEQQVCLLNRRFLHASEKRLSENTDPSGALILQEGVLQNEVGILFGTNAFFAGISQEELIGCLDVHAIGNQSQAERRLKELGQFKEERNVFGGESSRSGRAAILVVAK